MDLEIAPERWPTTGSTLDTGNGEDARDLGSATFGTEHETPSLVPAVNKSAPR